jgi:starvation-inducible DNA-binding protein
MHKTRNDLPDNVRKAAIDLLQARLADVVDLGTQTKQAHWNVKGPNFIALHELFDTIAGEVNDYTDLIAERVVTLGGIAEGTAAVAAERSRLPRYPLDIADGVAHVEALANVLASFGKVVRGNIDQASDMGDQDTADIFTEISRGIDKSLWFVEAHGQASR